MSYARKSLSQLYRDISSLEKKHSRDWKAIKDLHGSSGVEDAENIGYSKGLKDALKKIKTIISIMVIKPLRDDDRDYRIERLKKGGRII